MSETCKILRKLCENFVFRGWQRLVVFCECGVVRVVELVKFLEKSWCGE